MYFEKDSKIMGNNPFFILGNETQWETETPGDTQPVWRVYMVPEQKHLESSVHGLASWQDTCLDKDVQER